MPKITLFRPFRESKYNSEDTMVVADWGFAFFLTIVQLHWSVEIFFYIKVSLLIASWVVVNFYHVWPFELFFFLVDELRLSPFQLIFGYLALRDTFQYFFFLFNYFLSFLIFFFVWLVIFEMWTTELAFAVIISFVHEKFIVPFIS